MESEKVYQSTSYFSGRVQGVGFRYLTLQIAKEFEVSGIVKNLPDGRVLLETEGTESQVKAFTAEVDDRLGVFIRNIERSDGKRSPSYKGFGIR